ncbi:sulfur carrier protein ThiS [Granulicella sp. WH15]|uniref:sulfur carrier protein ThiS n=1 Tax=Granulicella sp. WH15 TaxID=2602070 RepID=UPI0013670ABE|nr:sulfur carrier protein ThiS [Granulicella sp. WH15]QHN03480.1 sulfur carrier protein ThiS [Granulicella sp. WH15]
MSLVLIVNGRERSFESLAAGSTVDEVVRELGLQSDRVAVEWNGEIVPRTAWVASAVVAGDKLEVVHFVGGGCVGLSA